MTTTDRPRRLARARAAIVAALASGFVLLGLIAGGSAARADSTIAGVQFHTSVECGGSYLLFSTNTVQDSGSWAKIWVYDYNAGRWITDNAWQQADAGA
jgi:hypothetical protein